MDKKQTAVEWLIEKFNEYDLTTGKADFRRKLNQAKQMEKEQIMDAATWGANAQSGEQFYNETYGKD